VDGVGSSKVIIIWFRLLGESGKDREKKYQSNGKHGLNGAL
jgi:hypothetical protein